MVKFLKNCQKAVFDSSKEAFWCTERKAKDTISLKRMVTKKNPEKPPTLQFLCFLVKIVNFWRLFLFLSESILCKELGVLLCIQCTRMLLLSHQKWLPDNFSKCSPQGGTLLIKGGSKFQARRRRGRKLKKKDSFWISMTKLTQKWVVDVWWTSFGCMAAL